jgi:hypothetical protein
MKLSFTTSSPASAGAPLSPLFFPGCAQMFSCAEDDLFIRHTPNLRKRWRTIGAVRIIRMAQARAEHLARFNRKQALKSDDWMDQSLPF